MFKEEQIEDKQYKELNEKFEQNLQELADLLKEIHDKIMADEINNRDEMIGAYEEKLREVAEKFPDIHHERVCPYIQRYQDILVKFDEYKKKEGRI